MSRVTDLQKRHCFAWTVERPLAGRPRTSGLFTIGNIDYHLEFSVELESKEKCYYLKVGPVKETPTCVTVHVEDRHGNALPLSDKVDLPSSASADVCCDKTIWEYTECSILEKFPNFHTEGVLTFLVTFETDEPPKAGPQDKGLQTEDSVSKCDNDDSQQDGASDSEENARDPLPDICLEGLSDDLSKLLLDGGDFPPDVELACGGLVLGAHKVILGARSKVLAASLSNFADDNGSGRIDVQNVEPGIFKHFVRYLYTGTLPKLTLETARQFYEAGDKYAVRSLTKRCSLFMKGHLGPDNACEMLALADEHYDQDLKEHIITYFFQKRIHLQDDHWVDFCKSHPMLAIEVLSRFSRLKNNL